MALLSMVLVHRRTTRFIEGVNRGTATVRRKLRAFGAWSSGAAAAVLAVLAVKVNLARAGWSARVRPFTTIDGRRAAAKIVEDEPGASPRRIAGRTGLPTGAARDVRDRVRRGEDPVPLNLRTDGADCGSAVRRVVERGVRHRAGIRRTLRRDPSISSTEEGRALLRWLSAHAAEVDRWDTLVGAVPLHCTALTAELANECAESWAGFADELRRRAPGDALYARLSG